MDLSRLVRTPLKLVPPGRKSVTKLRMLVEFTVAYLEKWITVFMSMPQKPHTAFDISLVKFGPVAYVAGFLRFLETTRGRQLTMYCITGRMQYSASTYTVQSLKRMHVSNACFGSTLFHLWGMVQIFQRESIFCSKISFGGSLFIKKLVPGGTKGPFLPHDYHDRPDSMQHD